MAKRRKLSELISEETQQSERTIKDVTKSVSTEVTNSVSPERKESQVTEITSDLPTQVTEKKTNETTSLQEDEVPKYLTFVRKEARLRSEQLDSLTSLTRSLNRKRNSNGERITENTLIRVAIDLLLDRSEELKGTTEQEIKKSIGL